MLAIAVVLILSGSIAPAQSGEPYRTSSPFKDLHTLEGVTTSNDEHGIWIYWTASEYSLLFPSRRVLVREAGADTPDDVAIMMSCRTDGRPDGYGPEPLSAVLLLPLHPDDPDVWNVLDPPYWLRALTGRGVVRTSLRVRTGDQPAYDSELVRYTINYSFARPDQEVEVEPVSVLQGLSAGSDASVLATGQGTRLVVAFSPQPPAHQHVAGLMLEHCKSV